MSLGLISLHSFNQLYSKQHLKEWTLRPAHLESRQISELSIYPAVDPLDSTSRMLSPHIFGDNHFKTARGAVYKHPQELSELTDAHARIPRRQDPVEASSKLSSSLLRSTIRSGSRRQLSDRPSTRRIPLVAWGTSPPADTARSELRSRSELSPLD